ncbi:hypothetical protein DEO72_LG11g2890 [Vigna unguiculata]|uniref:Uncharacterized protein n=1 Tax=Vigna unguiculata TaxID=3917 RepID=A0A4D6NR65_VIGUN|nr:hypothetical protein DEO72_LG11g2890 [Vigna unguiculata]
MVDVMDYNGAYWHSTDHFDGDHTCKFNAASSAGEAPSFFDCSKWRIETPLAASTITVMRQPRAIPSLFRLAASSSPLELAFPRHVATSPPLQFQARLSLAAVSQKNTTFTN